MDGASEGSPKEYVGFVWIGDEPGIRVSVWAYSALEAKEKLVDLYGEGHTISIKNLKDASTPR